MTDESVQKTAAEEISEIQAHLAEPEQPQSSDWRAFLNWAHLGTTVTLAIFLWNQYQTFLDERRNIAERIAIIETKIQKLETAVPTGATRDQIDNIRQLIDAISSRVDIHRQDIRQLQSDFVTHLQGDARKFDRIGVK